MARPLPPSLPLLSLLSTLPPVLGSSSSAALREEGYYHRPDPLRGFKRYEGGYNIRSSHYWASAIFTGVHGYVIAVTWIVGGLGCLGYLRARNKNPHSSTSSSGAASTTKSYCHLLVVLAMFVFTLLAIVASGTALIANHSFHRWSKKMEESIYGAADASCHAMQRVLAASKDISERVCPYNGPICTFLSTMSTELGNELVTVQQAMHKDGHRFDVMFGLFPRFVVMETIHSRILPFDAYEYNEIWCDHGHCVPELGDDHYYNSYHVAAVEPWTNHGDFHMLDFNWYTKDTCSALKEYEQCPSSSSLGSTLPCPKSSFADTIMAQIGLGIHGMISQLNSNIEVLAMKYGLEAQRLGLKICDPFSNAPKYNYDPGKCSSDSIPVSDLLIVLEKAKPFVSEAAYIMFSAYAHSMQRFAGVFADLQRLIHCSFLKDAFRDALLHQCKPLKVSIGMLWSSMVVLSASMVALVVAFISKIFQTRGRSLSGES